MKLTRLFTPLINTHLCQRAFLHGTRSIDDSRRNHSLAQNIEDDVFSQDIEPKTCALPALPTKTKMPQSIEKIGSVSRKFKWENPGENRSLIASYLEGSYTGWHVHYLQQYPELNRHQRKVMFEKECEEFIFSENPANLTPEELGLKTALRIPKRQLKIKLVKPNDIVYHHDLCEMWKRRQQIEIPFVNVGSYVEIKSKSGYAAQPPLTFSGLCIMKSHRDLYSFVTLRRSFESQEGAFSHFHCQSNIVRKDLCLCICLKKNRLLRHLI